MLAKFRTGQIVACSYFLEAVDRSAMVQAIIRHATTQPQYDGQPIRTYHRHSTKQFHLETGSDRQKTMIRLG